MGDISAEPSMEDILSSIKRIIAEENDSTPGRNRRPPRPLSNRPEPQPFDHEEILELNEPAPEPPVRPAMSAPVAAPVPAAQPQPQPLASTAPVPAPVAPLPAPESDAIVSQHAADATRGPLDALSRLVVKPEVSGSDTLEGMVREMLRPMLKDWLDAQLPAMVEAMVAREIERITGK